MTEVLIRSGNQTQGDPVRTGRRLHLQAKKIGLRRSQCWDTSIWDFQLQDGGLWMCAMLAVALLLWEQTNAQ